MPNIYYSRWLPKPKNKLVFWKAIVHILNKKAQTFFERIDLANCLFPGNPATHPCCRVGGFASHSFERFAFLTYFIGIKTMQITCQLINEFKVILFQDVALKTTELSLF